MDQLDTLCFPGICKGGKHVWVFGHRNVWCAVCGEPRQVRRNLPIPAREPNTHRCPNGCPPAPGPDFYNQLCGQCQDEVFADWSREESCQ